MNPGVSVVSEGIDFQRLLTPPTATELTCEKCWRRIRLRTTVQLVAHKLYTKASDAGGPSGKDR